MLKKHYWNILEAIHVKMFGVFLFVCLLQVALKIPQMPTATSICSGLGQEARTLSASLIVGDRDLSTQAVCWHPGCALARSRVMSGEGELKPGVSNVGHWCPRQQLNHSNQYSPCELLSRFKKKKVCLLAEYINLSQT